VPCLPAGFGSHFLSVCDDRQHGALFLSAAIFCLFFSRQQQQQQQPPCVPRPHTRALQSRKFPCARCRVAMATRKNGFITPATQFPLRPPLFVSQVLPRWDLMAPSPPGGTCSTTQCRPFVSQRRVTTTRLNELTGSIRADRFLPVTGRRCRQLRLRKGAPDPKSPTWTRGVERFAEGAGIALAGSLRKRCS
jgi:hypothetical protein